MLLTRKIKNMIHNPLGLTVVMLGQAIVTLLAVWVGIQELYVIVPAVIFCVENVMFHHTLRQDKAQRRQLFYACAYGMAKPYDAKRAAVPIVFFLLSCMFLLHAGYVIAALLAGVAALLHQTSYDMLVSVCNTGEIDETHKCNNTEKKQ